LLQNKRSNEPARVNGGPEKPGNGGGRRKEPKRQDHRQKRSIQKGIEDAKKGGLSSRIKKKPAAGDAICVIKFDLGPIKAEKVKQVRSKVPSRLRGEPDMV